MAYLIIIAIVLIGIAVFIESNSSKTEKADNQDIKENEFKHYSRKNCVMTKTELMFYEKLKRITDKNDMTIFSQVNLEGLIEANNNEIKYRNKIRSRTIDYVIVSNSNCKTLLAIELDDYTHNYKTRVERDKFINELFNYLDIPLLRIKVSNNYNMSLIELKIKELSVLN